MENGLLEIARTDGGAVSDINMPPHQHALLSLSLLASRVAVLMAWEMCSESIMHADTSEQRFGIWAHAWGSDPALGPVILQCAYDWAVDDSRSKPYIRLEFEEAMVLDQLIGAEIAYDSESEQPPTVRSCSARPVQSNGPHTRTAHASRSHTIHQHVVTIFVSTRVCAATVRNQVGGLL